jgi:hypothetical protein
MSLADFKAQYANNGGTVECATPLVFSNRVADSAALPCSRNQLNFFTNSRTDPSNQIFIFFSDEKSVGVKTMRKFVYSPYTLTCRHVSNSDSQLFSPQAAQHSGGEKHCEGYYYFPGHHDVFRKKGEIFFSPWIDLLSLF